MNIVLVIAPHPDDEVLGCGGSMARHVAQGDQVYVLVVSRGAPSLFADAVIEETRAELVQAHKIIGVTSVEFLDFPAPQLDTISMHIIADAISKVIRRLTPNILYIPHRGDIHSDHKIVCDAALVAARPVNQCSVKKILCYETLSETEWGYPIGSDVFSPTVFINISNFLEKKLQAMSCFKTQLKPAPNSRSLLAVETLARHRGHTIGYTAAEAFVLIREIAG